MSENIYAEHLWGHIEVVLEEQKRLSNLFFLLKGALFFKEVFCTEEIN